MKIHGIVISKDDWGQLAVSVSHALCHHVDVVHVLDHGSVDQTASGLQVLREAWGSRLRIYSSGPELPFRQSVLTNMLVSIAESEGADWIYVFDSDEFLLTQSGTSLRQLLGKLDDNTVSVRYAVRNYISTFDFNRLDLDCYGDLRYKSLPGTYAGFEPAWDAIYAERASFFDFPFPSKLIFRTRKDLLVEAGNHALLWKLPGQAIVNMTNIGCAHLTYISRDILDRKKQLGEALIGMGHPRRHGWQSQLIYQLHQEGRLDAFWDRHSIKKDHIGTTQINHAIDESLVHSLKPSIEILKKIFGGSFLGSRAGVPLPYDSSSATPLSFADAFQMCAGLETKIRRLIHAHQKAS